MVHCNSLGTVLGLVLFESQPYEKLRVVTHSYNSSIRRLRLKLKDLH